MRRIVSQRKLSNSFGREYSDQTNAYASDSLVRKISEETTRSCQQ